VASCSPATTSPTSNQPSSEQSQPNTQPSLEEVVSIRFAGWGNAEELQLYENIAKAHMEEDPKIKIEVLGMPSSDYSQKILLGLQAVIRLKTCAPAPNISRPCMPMTLLWI
jgi:ABC-type glycerol-3-phosphate transport system substrate-binding protein